MLPRLDRLLSGGDFDPQAEEATFRVAVTDHASHVLCPLICRMVLPEASKVSIEFVSFGDQTFDAIEKGRLDLMLNADDGYLPPHFASEMIFDDSFSCVAAKESEYPGVLTLKQYMAAQHVGLKPPEVLGRFNYLMARHPRMNTDAAHIWLRRAIRQTGKALSS